MSKPQNHSTQFWSHIIVSGFGKNMDGYGLVEVCHLCSPNKILYLQMLPVSIYPAYSGDILLIICPHHSNHMSQIHQVMHQYMDVEY